MKKKNLKLLSLFLTAVMLLSFVPAFGINASAATNLSDVSASPTALPDGTDILTTKTWIDWDEKGVSNSSNGTVTSDGFYKVLKANANNWCANNAYTADWRGASGFMFYVDKTEAEGVDFIFEILTDSNHSGSVQLQTCPTNAATGNQAGATSTAYQYNETTGKWESFSISHRGWYLTAPNRSGWCYLPFTSIFYHGGSGNLNNAVAGAVGKNLTEFMSYAEGYQLWKLSIKSNKQGLKFSNVSFVYTKSAESVTSSVTAPIFNSTYTGLSTEGSATKSVSNGSVTVSGVTGNSAQGSENRVWLRGFENADMMNADGIRFHVDTTALGNAALRLRIRPQVAYTPGQLAISGLKLYSKSSIGYLESPAGGYMQAVARAGDSVAYCYPDGVETMIRINDATNGEGDIFAALPVGYVGDVYIPVDSFYWSFGSHDNNVILPWNAVVEKCSSLTALAICGAYEGTPTSDSVTYSNFEWVYDDAAITGASVTLRDSFDLNFYAKADRTTVSDLSLTYEFAGKTGNWTEELSATETTLTYSHILPQQAVDKMTLKLTGKINNVAVSQTVEYGIADYCNALLEKDQNRKLVDLLEAVMYYAANAQIVDGYRIDDLVTEGWAAMNKVTDKSPTYVAKLEDSTNVDYQFEGATVRLRSTLALRLFMKLKSTDNVEVVVKMFEDGSKTATRTESFTADNFALTNSGYAVMLEGINADQYDSKIEATIIVNNDEVQTLTYSVNAYLANVTKDSYTGSTGAMKQLAESIYNYGVAAAAYVEGTGILGNS